MAEQIVGWATFIGGLALLWIYAGWQIALAVFLLQWSHNIEKHI